MNHGVAAMLLLATWAGAGPAHGQDTTRLASSGTSTRGSSPSPAATRDRARPRVEAALRVEVRLGARALRVLRGADTLQVMRVAVASGDELRVGGRRWRFRLAPGTRTVLAKRVAPVWIPPDWHYAEEALAQHLELRRWPAAGVRLADGRRLLLRDSVVGVLTDGDPYFNALPIDEHIVFGGRLYIPPLGSHNRQVAGALGRYALDLGDGYLLHGTLDAARLGTASTHGCVQLADDDLAWLFANVPVGTRVVIRR